MISPYVALQPSQVTLASWRARKTLGT